MVVTDFFFRPFSKILPLTTKKDNPSFYFHAHYEKTVIVGTRMNCSAAALSKKEKQKWVMWWRKRRGKRETLDEWDKRVANHVDRLKITTSKLKGECMDGKQAFVVV